MYLTQAQSDDEKYSHIEQADKEKVVSGSLSVARVYTDSSRLRNAQLPNNG